MLLWICLILEATDLKIVADLQIHSYDGEINYRSYYNVKQSNNATSEPFITIKVIV